MVAVAMGSVLETRVTVPYLPGMDTLVMWNSLWTHRSPRIASSALSGVRPPSSPVLAKERLLLLLPCAPRLVSRTSCSRTTLPAEPSYGLLRSHRRRQASTALARS